MNNKIKIPILCIATVVALVPVMYFGGIIPVNNSAFTLLPLYGQDVLMQASDFIFEGVLISNSTYVEWEQRGNNIVVPVIYTDWKLKVTDTIKGNSTSDIVFRVDGGKYNNMEQHDFESKPLRMGEHVLVYISKSSLDSVYEGAYYITGSDNGVFVIDSNNTAYNEYRNKTMQLDDLKRELRSLAGT